MESDLTRLIEDAIKQEFNLRISIPLEYAPAGKGDFSSNAAFQIAGQSGRKPAEVAKKLAESLSSDLLEKAEAAGPYLNLTVKGEYWVKELSCLGPDYGQSGACKGEKVQVEFISANPTGPLTIGNARGGYIGDVLANVLETQGCAVTREYYFNDAGTQVMKLVDSARIAAGLANPPVGGGPEYKGKYLEELAAELKDKLEASDMDAALALTQAIRERYLEPAIKNMRISLDRWVNERDLRAEYDKLEQKLLDGGAAAQKEGAVWALSTKFGDERDRVLRKSSGDISYLGTDLAYHQQIFGPRGFKRAIKVLGADHSGQVLSLKIMLEQAMKVKGQLDFLVYQFVRLIKDGKEVKIGKRLGTYVTTDELIEEAGADVARWFMLSRSPDSHMDFDLNLAKEQSQKNPYWYVMYAYVRAKSILAKAQSSRLKAGNLMEELNGRERELVRQISRFPALLEDISETLAVHQLTFFGSEIARLFHDYYEQERIIGLSDKEASEKLYFVQQISSFFERYFAVLGLKPLEKM